MTAITCCDDGLIDVFHVEALRYAVSSVQGLRTPKLSIHVAPLDIQYCQFSAFNIANAMRLAWPSGKFNPAAVIAMVQLSDVIWQRNLQRRGFRSV